MSHILYSILHRKQKVDDKAHMPTHTHLPGSSLTVCKCRSLLNNRYVINHRMQNHRQLKNSQTYNN